MKKLVGRVAYLMRLSALVLIWGLPAAVAQEPGCSEHPERPLGQLSQQVIEALMGQPELVFPNLQAAIEAKLLARAPVRMLTTGNPQVPSFPSYSQCERTFFRVAVVPAAIDRAISAQGWQSGWVRREQELRRQGQENPAPHLFDGLPPSAPMEDRIIQYVRVKNRNGQFPKHSSVVGVLESPIRALSVTYHTGYNEGMRGLPMRLDEIELGPCAKAPQCRSVTPVDSSAVFRARNLQPRYSTEGEWGVDREIPPACVVATYRINFQKVDTACYSDSNGNCGAFRSP